MLNRFVVAATIKPGMEIITKDGRRAGYVARVHKGELITDKPTRRIPLTCIRRVEADVYIEPLLTDLQRWT